MGSTSQRTNMLPGTVPVPGATCETEATGKIESTRQTIIDAEPCYCPYCRSLVRAARNTSPLAAIDVYSLPDETDVLHAPDYSH
jgi:hypothetical protein